MRQVITNVKSHSIEPLIMRYQRRKRRSKKLYSVLMRPSQLHKQEMFITFFSEQNGEIQNSVFIRPGHRNMFILIGLKIYMMISKQE
jgi:hypothetical protein